MSNLPENPDAPPESPVPTSVNVYLGTTDAGGAFVVLCLDTPVGRHVVYLPPDAADVVGARLRQTARDARAGGLSVARGPLDVTSRPGSMGPTSPFPPLRG